MQQDNNQPVLLSWGWCPDSIRKLLYAVRRAVGDDFDLKAGIFLQGPDDFAAGCMGVRVPMALRVVRLAIHPHAYPSTLAAGETIGIVTPWCSCRVGLWA